MRMPVRILAALVLAMLVLACAPAATPTTAPPPPSESKPAATTAPAQPEATSAAEQPAATTQPQTAAKPSGQPVLVGVAISLSGKQAQPGEDQLRGIQLWVEDVNNNGGLLGRPVELKYYDDQSDPQTSAKLLEKLITEDKVDLIIGPYASAALSAASTVSEKYKKPLIAPGAASAEIFERGYMYVFQTYSPARGQAEPLVQLAKANGFQTVALINEDTPFGNDFANGMVAAANDAGLEIVMHEKYTVGSADFSSLIQKLKASNADVVAAGATFQDSTVLVRQAKEANLTPKMLTFGAAGPATAEFAEVVGSAAEGIMGVSQWEPSAKYPGNQEFVEAFKAKFDREPSYTAAGGYGAGQIIVDAVKQANSLDAEKIREAYASLDTMTVFGKYKVDETGLQVGHNATVIEIQNGEKTVVYPEDAAEAEPKLPFPGWQ